MKESRFRLLTAALRLLEGLLLVVGLVAAGWYATAQIGASREQASLSRELDRFRSAPKPMSGLVGRIEVPRVKLSAVAREGVDVSTLRRAVGHIPGTALPGQQGNAAFAGHRDTFFGPLKSVRRGDEVIMTTPGGVFRYSITSTRIVAPDDISVLDPTDEASLTLVTCYPFDYLGSAPQRFIVHATLNK